MQKLEKILWGDAKAEFSQLLLARSDGVVTVALTFATSPPPSRVAKAPPSHMPHPAATAVLQGGELAHSNVKEQMRDQRLRGIIMFGCGFGGMLLMSLRDPNLTITADDAMKKAAVPFFATLAAFSVYYVVTRTVYATKAKAQ